MAQVVVHRNCAELVLHARRGAMQAARRQAIGRRGGWPGRLAPSQADRAGGFIAGLGCRWGGTVAAPSEGTR